MWELDVKLKQLPVWELVAYPGELEVGGTPESLVPLVGSKPHMEDCNDIDEDEVHLYIRVKMLYEEGYKPKPVLTQGTEDTILIISSLSPPHLQHAFYYPQQSCPTNNMASLLDSSFSEHEGPPPPE